MTDCLYYPHYTPSALHLRGALLFYENLRSIVPQEDQYHVKNRDHVAEITQIANEEDRFEHEKTVGMLFPEPAYFDWWNNPTEKSLLRTEILKHANSKELSSYLQSLAYKPHPYDYFKYMTVDVDGQSQELLVEQMRPKG